MTTDIETPIQTYVISGSGPYALPWPYGAGDVKAALVAGGLETPLTQISVSPASSDSGGNLTLTGSAAVDHAGKVLRITRNTIVEQGWAAQRGEREVGMEVSLDTLARGLQDVQATGKALRADIAALTGLASYSAALQAVAEAAGLTVLEYTGDGVTTAYTLPEAPLSKDSVEIVVEGTVQIQRDFTLSGATLTLPEPVPAGLRFDIKIRTEFPYGWVHANQVQMQSDNMLGSILYAFATRAAFVGAQAALSPAAGAFAQAGGLAYLCKPGATAIADLLGWVPAGGVTPEHFGADNTGVTSASAAINAAIDFLPGGGTVFLSGTYLLTARIDVPSRIWLVPNGTPTLVRGGNSFAMLSLQGAADNLDTDYAVVQGLRIDGRKGTYADGVSILICGSYNTVQDNEVFDSPGHSISLKGSIAGTYVSVGTVCTVTIALDFALTPGQSVHMQFEGTVPDGDYTVTSVTSPSVFVLTLAAPITESGYSANIRTHTTANNTVQRNLVRDGGKIGISQHTAPNNFLLRNLVRDCASEGVTIDNESSRCLVDGNHLLNNASPGGCGQIGLDASPLTRIVNNRIEGTGSTGTLKPGVCLNNAAGDTNLCTIANNAFIGCTGPAIHCKHLAVPIVGSGGYYSASFNVFEANNFSACASAVQIDATCTRNRVSGVTGSNAASRTVLDKGTDNEVEGAIASPPHFSYTGAATMLPANLRKTAQRYNSGAGANLQLPAGADLDTEFPEIGVDRGREFSVICVAAGAATLTVNTGVTIIGNPIVAAGTSVIWRLVKTAAATWIAYRMAG
jgi:archaellum component FlaG (FlaF/FlaG flagellin family)